MIFPMPTWVSRECLTKESTKNFGNSPQGCQECTGGSISHWDPSSNVRVCIPCPKGTSKYHEVAMGQLSHVCSACDFGRFSNQDSSDDCMPCPIGRFAGTIGLSECQACLAGTAVSDHGSSQCQACEPGKWMVQEGATQCKRCGVGEFMPSRNATACRPCPAGLTTSGSGAMAEDECICPVKQYLTKNRDGAASCLPCPEGMSCEVGSVSPLSTDIHNKSLAHPVPQPGYWSSSMEPMTVYRCASLESCPGGRYGACGDHRHGLACAVCDKGYVSAAKHGGCRSCTVFEESVLLYPWGPLLFGPMIIILRYLPLMWDDALQWGTWWYAPCSSLSVLFLHYQVLGFTQMMKVEYPPLVANSFAPWKLLLNLGDLMRPSCTGFHDFSTRFIAKLTGPVLLAVIIIWTWMLTTAASMVIYKRFVHILDVYKVFNVFMGLVLMFYVSIGSASLSLFMCYPHPKPNKSRSLLISPEILCFEPEWYKYVGLAILVLTYVVFMTAFVAYICLIAPSRFQHADFRAKYSCLFCYFEPDVWWWRIPCMMYGLAVSCSQVIFSTPAFKLMGTMTSLILYMGAVQRFRPWRHLSSNVLDMWTSWIACFIMSLCFWWAGRTEQESDDLAAQVAVTCGYTPLLLAVMTLFLLYKECSAVAAHARVTKTLAQSVKAQGSFRFAANLPQEELHRFMHSISRGALTNIMTCHGIIRSELQGERQSIGIAGQRLVLSCASHVETSSLVRIHPSPATDLN